MTQRMIKYHSLVLALVLSWGWNTSSAQPLSEILLHRDNDTRPHIMIVGSAHFANPGQDNINVAVKDVLSPEQQRGIRDFVEVLEQFQPTHVAVEALKERQRQLDERYTAYLEGSADLGRSELDQLGMRLAKAMEHESIYAIDWQGSPPGGFSDSYDWYEYARAAGLENRLAAVSDPDIIEEYAVQGDRTITDWIEAINSPEGRLAFHRIYFDVALIGDNENHPGANWVGHWYTRNFMIFNNIVRLSRNVNDRILVIYGAGHAHLLRQFASESKAFEVVDLKDYL